MRNVRELLAAIGGGKSPPHEFISDGGVGEACEELGFGRNWVTDLAGQAGVLPAEAAAIRAAIISDPALPDGKELATLDEAELRYALWVEL